MRLSYRAFVEKEGSIARQRMSINYLILRESPVDWEFVPAALNRTDVLRQQNLSHWNCWELRRISRVGLCRTDPSSGARFFPSLLSPEQLTSLHYWWLTDSGRLLIIIPYIKSKFENFGFLDKYVFQILYTKSVTICFSDEQVLKLIYYATSILIEIKISNVYQYIWISTQ